MFSVTSNTARPSTELLSSLAALASAGLVSAGSAAAAVKGKKSNQQQSDHLICEVRELRGRSHSLTRLSPGLWREGGETQLLRGPGLPELPSLLQEIRPVQVRANGDKIMSNVMSALKFTNIPSDCSYMSTKQKPCRHLHLHLCNRYVRFIRINNTYTYFCHFFAYYQRRTFVVTFSVLTDPIDVNQ